MESKKTNIPKRRFAGFSDAWEQRKLGEIYDFQYGEFNNNPDNGGKYPIYGANGIIGGYTNYNAENSSVIGHMGAYAGHVVWAEGRHFVTYNGTIAKPSTDSTDSKFGFYMLCKKEIYKICAGSGQPFVSYNDLNGIEVDIPTKKEEQAKIAEYFSNLDHLITLHQRKLDKLKDMKKSYLSEMFPQPGEKKPRRRFKGFTEDWEQRKFRDTFDFMQNNALSRADLSGVDGDVMNVHYGDVLVKYGEVLDVKKDELTYLLDASLVKKYQASLLQNGDIIIADAAEDETVGKCSEIAGLTDEMVLSGLHTIPCRPKENFAEGYLGYYMNSGSYHDQLLPLIQGTKISSISKSAIQDTDIRYPKSESEQEQIGEYFQNLDHLITLHQRKLDKLKNIKQAYLNEMFVK